MPVLRFECPFCSAPFEWPQLPPESMTCPACAKTFEPAAVASTATIDQVSPVGIAISGGGHRAALFGLGALLAIVDLGLNRRVVQITSVSGGSLLNAFVALRCAFQEARTESFDRVAAQLASVIVNRGVLTRRWIGAMLALPFAAFSLALALQPYVPLPRALYVVIVVGLCLTMFLFRGWAVEWFLNRRLFGCVRIGAIPARAVEHVMCCTELSLGKPCYISTHNNGQLYLRSHDYPQRASRTGEWFNVPKLLLTSAVRASAAFPGIPPRRLVVRRDGRPERMSFGGTVPEAAVPALRRTLYLSDGGVWGNLATQALLDERLFRGECNAETTSDAPAILLVVNASSGVAPVSSWQFAVPAYAEIKALLRAMLIQNENTVEPRVAGLLDNLRRHVVEDAAGCCGDPKVLPISISDNPRDLFPILWHGRWRPGSSAALVNWALKLGDRVSEAFWRGADAEPTLLAELRKIDETRPRDSDDPDKLRRAQERLETNSQWHRLCDLAQDVGPVATTLDRIARSTAQGLIARGYALTLAALFIFGISGQKLPEHVLSQERLDALVTN